MNVFWFELKALRRSTLSWILALCGLSGLFLSIFPAYSTHSQAVKSLFEGFPDPVLKAFGIQLDIFFSISGFYSFVFIYIALIGAIQAMYLGLAIISKESRMKTSDFLMTKPIKRWRIMLNKTMAALLSLVATNLVYTAFTSFIASLVADGDFSLNTILLQNLSLFLLQLMFMSLGIFFGTYARKVRSVISMTMGTVFGFYALSMLGAVIGDEKIRYVSPFKYYEPSYIIYNVAYEWEFVLLTFVWILTATVLSFWHYNRKEIHSL